MCLQHATMDAHAISPCDVHHATFAPTLDRIPSAISLVSQKRLSWNCYTSKTTTKRRLHVISACMGSCDSHVRAIDGKKGVTSAERVQIHAGNRAFQESHAIGIAHSRHAVDVRFQASPLGPPRGMWFYSTKGNTHDKHEGPNQCGLRETSAVHDEKGSAHATLHRPRER